MSHVNYSKRARLHFQTHIILQQAYIKRSAASSDLLFDQLKNLFVFKIGQINFKTWNKFSFFFNDFNPQNLCKVHKVTLAKLLASY